MIDLYGGYAEIYLKKGANGPLRSIQSVARPNSTSGGGPQKVQFVSSVSVKVSTFRFTEIDVVLNPTYDEAVNLVRSGLLGPGYTSNKKNQNAGSSAGDGVTSAPSLSGLNQLVVKMSYGGVSTKFYSGVSLFPEFDVSGDGIVIQLKAIGHLSLAGQGARNKVVKGQSNKDMLDELSGSGTYFDLKVDPNDSLAASAMAGVQDRNLVQRDIDQIQSMLREKGLYILDNGSPDPNGKSVLLIGSRDFARKKATRTFVAYKQINPNKGIFPIFSLKTNIVNYAFGQTAKQFVDSSEKEKAQRSEERTVSSPDGTEGSDPSSEGRQPQTYPSESFSGEVNTLKERVAGLATDFFSSAAQFEIETVAVFDQIPARPVKIEVGQIEFLTGVYDCLSVEHSISEDGCISRILAGRTFGTAQVIDKAVTKADSVVNQGGTGTVKKVSSNRGVNPD